jgi:hypothetical protein
MFRGDLMKIVALGEGSLHRTLFCGRYAQGKVEIRQSAPVGMTKGGAARRDLSGMVLDHQKLIAEPEELG